MAAKELTIQQKKDWAKLLFVRESVTVNKELASRTGVSEKTIGKWRNDENWDRLRASNIITKDEQLSRLYMQLTELNDFIMKKEVGMRFADGKQADVISKITASIRQLETESSVADAMEVGMKFINFVRSVDFENLQLTTTLFDGFIKKIINESGR